MNWWKLSLSLAVLVSFLASGPVLAVESTERQIIIAKSEADYDYLKTQFVAGGGTVVMEMKQALSFVGLAPKEIHQRSSALAAAKTKGLYKVA